MKIDGKKIAEEVLRRLSRTPTPRKFLGVILVGNDSASKKFVMQKKNIADLLGIDFRVYQFSESIDADSLRSSVGRIGRGSTCGGLVVQLPLPLHLNRRRILNAIPKEKDIDVLSESAYAQFLSTQTLLPPSVSTYCEIVSYMQQHNVSRETFFDAKKYAVVGNGFLVGKPIFDYLRIQGNDVLVCDKGDDLKQIRSAHVVVLGTGIPNIIDETLVREDALVIDFGCSFIDGVLYGDFKKTTNEKILYTPTPGGTGPILVAKVFENFYLLHNT